MFESCPGQGFFFLMVVFSRSLLFMRAYKYAARAQRVNGYSRFVVSLCAADKNRGATVLPHLLKACSDNSVPSRVRGRSVHNHRIERL